MTFFKLLFYYRLASAKYALGFVLRNNAFNDSVKTNFDHQTFRFPKKATSDWRISLKIYKTIFLSQLKRQKMVLNNSADAVAIFDGDINSTGQRINYVKRLIGENPRLVVGRSELVKSVSVLLSVITLLSLTINFPLVFLVSVCSKNKLRFPLHKLNTIEALNILVLLRRHKIKRLHFFCIYENDTNLMAYSLMKSGIKINKIPSEVPLSFWNKVVVADSLSLCFRYQNDEYELYKKQMYVDEVNNWVPENAFELEKFYVKKNHAIKVNSIGFYSSAMWLREELGRIDLRDNAYLNEQSLFKFLLSFVNRNLSYKLIVFLHPLEKNNPERTKSYYAELSENIELADVTIPNSQQFYNADVGVTLFSTLSYERLFWGFKTLIYPLGHDDFPVNNSNFNNVCAKTERELELRLRAALDVSKDEFFRVNNLKDYRYFEYPYFKNKV